MNLALKPARTLLVRCSGEVVYQIATKSILQKVREKDAAEFREVQSCLGIVPPITSWYMFHDTR